MPSPVASECGEFPIKFSPLCWGDSLQTSSTASECSDRPKTRKSPKISKSRVTKACKRCRLRKIKCNGGKPCLRCSEADDVCEYSYRWKKESKEYAQGYIEQILEQNDKYKRAMRLLYANRRLSIQPDNMVLPSTEGHDVPLVHDILDRLGLLDATTEQNPSEEIPTDPIQGPVEEGREPTTPTSVSAGFFDNGSSLGDTMSESIPSTDDTVPSDYFAGFWNYGPPMQPMDVSMLNNDVAFPFPLDEFPMFQQPLDMEQTIDLADYAAGEDLEACKGYDAGFVSPSMSNYASLASMANGCATPFRIPDTSFGAWEPIGQFS